MAHLVSWFTELNNGDFPVRELLVYQRGISQLLFGSFRVKEALQTHRFRVAMALINRAEHGWTNGSFRIRHFQNGCSAFAKLPFARMQEGWKWCPAQMGFSFHGPWLFSSVPAFLWLAWMIILACKWDDRTANGSTWIRHFQNGCSAFAKLPFAKMQEGWKWCPAQMGFSFHGPWLFSSAPAFLWLAWMILLACKRDDGTANGSTWIRPFQNGCLAFAKLPFARMQEGWKWCPAQMGFSFHGPWLFSSVPAFLWLAWMILLACKWDDGTANGSTWIRHFQNGCSAFAKLPFARMQEGWKWCPAQMGFSFHGPWLFSSAPAFLWLAWMILLACKWDDETANGSTWIRHFQNGCLAFAKLPFARMQEGWKWCPSQMGFSFHGPWLFSSVPAFLWLAWMLILACKWDDGTVNGSTWIRHF